MYGLEKSPHEKFDFDLEIDIKENPAKGKELLTRIDNFIKEIKQTLKEGGKKEDLDKLGIILQGYMAMSKVIKNVQKS